MGSMLYRHIIGIDPGITGAIALFEGPYFKSVLDIPFTRDSNKAKKIVDTAKLAALLTKVYADVSLIPFAVYMELSHAMPGQGVSSMFAYGKVNGIIEGILAGIGMINAENPIRKVVPAVWKRRLGLLNNTKPKDAGLTMARALYPHADLSLKKHHNRAEAILIGRYGCLMEGLAK